MSSGELGKSLRILKIAIADFGPNPPLPESFDALAGIVEEMEGVRFRELFERLPRRAKDGDEALATVLDRVAELMRAEADEQHST